MNSMYITDSSQKLQTFVIIVFIIVSYDDLKERKSFAFRLSIFLLADLWSTFCLSIFV